MHTNLLSYSKHAPVHADIYIGQADVFRCVTYLSWFLGLYSIHYI